VIYVASGEQAALSRVWARFLGDAEQRAGRGERRRGGRGLNQLGFTGQLVELDVAAALP
jgi:hypothetical protein